MKLRDEYTCPLELIHDMIKGKWKPIILWRLRLGATSLSKLENDIDGITQKMLLEHLKELIDYGFVDKKNIFWLSTSCRVFFDGRYGKSNTRSITNYATYRD